jgi:hypothetical protein
VHLEQAHTCQSVCDYIHCRSVSIFRYGSVSRACAPRTPEGVQLRKFRAVRAISAVNPRDGARCNGKLETTKRNEAALPVPRRAFNTSVHHGLTARLAQGQTPRPSTIRRLLENSRCCRSNARDTRCPTRLSHPTE